MQHIQKHFQQDSVLSDLFERHPITRLRSETNPDLYFSKLCRDIIGQQLSIKAADTIIKRFENLFPELKSEAAADENRQLKTISAVITPALILELEDQTLRDVGLSWSKVKYVKDLADKTESGALQLQRLPQLSDAEVITELTQVKGIGPWTAEMFLIFTLGREDVFSFGDLGLRRAMERAYQIEDWQQEQDRIQEIVARWQPYRSYASLVLWKSLDNA